MRICRPGLVPVLHVGKLHTACMLRTCTVCGCRVATPTFSKGTNMQDIVPFCTYIEANWCSHLSKIIWTFIPAYSKHCTEILTILPPFSCFSYQSVTVLEPETWVQKFCCDVHILVLSFQEHICPVSCVLEEKATPQLAITVDALLNSAGTPKVAIVWGQSDAQTTDLHSTVKFYTDQAKSRHSWVVQRHHRVTISTAVFVVIVVMQWHHFTSRKLCHASTYPFKFHFHDKHNQFIVVSTPCQNKCTKNSFRSLVSIQSKEWEW